MRNVRHIFVREYLERVRSKAFIIITFLTPLLFALLFGLPIFLASRVSGTQNVAVVDLGGRVLPVLEQRLQERAAAVPGQQRGEPQQFRLQRVPVEPGREEEVRERLSREVRQGRLDSFLWLGADAPQGGPVEYYARNLTDFAGINRLQSAVSSAIVAVRLMDRGVPAGQVAELVKSVRLRTLRISETGTREDRGRGLGTFMMSFFFMMVLYTTLIIYGVMVMRSVIEEKTSRVFEVLLSSVRPIELMAGKILGVAAVGLTQYLVWTLFFALAGGGLGALALKSQAGEIAPPPMVLVFFVVFFLLGYLLYSALYAALGAAVNTEQEGQQLQIAVVQFLILPVLVANFVLRSPNSSWAVGLSLFPFFAPILMFLRITVQTPPAWQIALCLALLVATIMAVLWGAARVYRIGILMYGKRPTLPELWRWVRTA